MGTNEEDSINVCDCYLPKACQLWNSATSYNCEDSLCLKGNKNEYIKNKGGYQICDGQGGCKTVTLISDINNICKDYDKGCSNPLLCTYKAIPFNSFESFQSEQSDQNNNLMTNKVEYVTLQNNRIEKQNKILDNIQKEIATKDAVINEMNKTYKNKHKTVRVLIIFFIFIVIFGLALMAKAYGNIGNTALILVILTLTIAYIYYIVWTFNKDKIPEYASNQFNKFKKTLGDGIDKSTKDITDPDHYIKEFNRYQELRRRQYINGNCECPDNPFITSEEENEPPFNPNKYRNIPVDVDTNIGTYYYDHSSPKQRIFPKVTKEDTKYNEFIQWSGGKELGNNVDNNIHWFGDSNINARKEMADPNWKSKQNDNDKVVNQNTENNITWTVNL